MKLPSNKSIVLCVTLLADLFLAVYGFYKFKELVYNLNLINQSRDKIYELAGIRATHLITQDLAAISQSLDQKNLFITPDKELDVIQTLEQMAADLNLRQTLNFGGQAGNAPKANNNTIPVTLDLTGSYPNELRYLTQMQTLNYLINITNLKIQVQSAEKSSAFSHMTLTGLGFKE